MTPQRTSAGFWRIDTTIRGIGRLVVTTSARTKRQYQDQLTLAGILRRGHRDILRAVIVGDLKWADVETAWRANTLDTVLRDRRLNTPLWKAVEKWINSMPVAPSTRARTAAAWATNERIMALPDTAAVRDLETVDWALRKREWTDAKKTEHGWYQQRQAVSGFLTHLLTFHHPFRLQLLNAIPVAKKKPKQVHLTYKQFLAVLGHVSEYLQPCFVTVAVTGMRKEEYARCGRMSLAETGLVIVPGTKTRKASRIVRVDPEYWPWVEQAIPCPVTGDHLSRVWRKAADEEKRKDLTLHSLRNAYSQWMGDAGVDVERIKEAMGHENINQTADYMRRPMRPEDAAALTTVVDPAQLPAVGTRAG